MSSLAGTYKYESQENYVEYLKALGLPDEQANKANEAEPTLVIGPIESDKITLTIFGHPVAFTLNKEIEYSLHGDIKKKAIATINGNVLTLKTNVKDDGSLVDEKIFTPSDSGLVISSSTNKGTKAVRRYKRV